MTSASARYRVELPIQLPHGCSVMGRYRGQFHDLDLWWRRPWHERSLMRREEEAIPAIPRLHQIVGTAHQRMRVAADFQLALLQQPEARTQSHFGIEEVIVGKGVHPRQTERIRDESHVTLSSRTRWGAGRFFLKVLARHASVRVWSHKATNWALSLAL